MSSGTGQSVQHPVNPIDFATMDSAQILFRNKAAFALEFGSILHKYELHIGGHSQQNLASMYYMLMGLFTYLKVDVLDEFANDRMRIMDIFVNEPLNRESIDHVSFLVLYNIGEGHISPSNEILGRMFVFNLNGEKPFNDFNDVNFGPTIDKIARMYPDENESGSENEDEEGGSENEDGEEVRFEGPSYKKAENILMKILRTTTIFSVRLPPSDIGKYKILTDFGAQEFSNLPNRPFFVQPLSRDYSSKTRGSSSNFLKSLSTSTLHEFYAQTAVAELYPGTSLFKSVIRDFEKNVFKQWKNDRKPPRIHERHDDADDGITMDSEFIERSPRRKDFAFEPEFSEKGFELTTNNILRFMQGALVLNYQKFSNIDIFQTINANNELLRLIVLHQKGVSGWTAESIPYIFTLANGDQPIKNEQIHSLPILTSLDNKIEKAYIIRGHIIETDQAGQQTEKFKTVYIQAMEKIDVPAMPKLLHYLIDNLKNMDNLKEEELKNFLRNKLEYIKTLAPGVRQNPEVFSTFMTGQSMMHNEEMEVFKYHDPLNSVDLDKILECFVFRELFGTRNSLVLTLKKAPQADGAAHSVKSRLNLNQHEEHLLIDIDLHKYMKIGTFNDDVIEIKKHKGKITLPDTEDDGEVVPAKRPKLETVERSEVNIEGPHNLVSQLGYLKKIQPIRLPVMSSFIGEQYFVRFLNTLNMNLAFPGQSLTNQRLRSLVLGLLVDRYPLFKPYRYSPFIGLTDHTSEPSTYILDVKPHQLEAENKPHLTPQAEDYQRSMLMPLRKAFIKDYTSDVEKRNVKLLRLNWPSNDIDKVIPPQDQKSLIHMELPVTDTIFYEGCSREYLDAQGAIRYRRQVGTKCFELSEDEKEIENLNEIGEKEFENYEVKDHFDEELKHMSNELYFIDLKVPSDDSIIEFKNDENNAKYKETSNHVDDELYSQFKKQQTTKWTRVSRIINTAMYLQMAKGLIGSAIDGDYKKFGENFGILGSMVGAGILGDQMIHWSTNYIATGNLLKGGMLNVGGRLLSKAYLGFVISDLVNRIGAYKNGDDDQIVGIIGDTMIITINVVATSLELFATFATVEEASVEFGPEVMIAEAIIFSIVDGFYAGRTVEKIEEVVHLTWSEDVVQWSRAFVSSNPSSYLLDLMHQKALNNAAFNNSITHLENHEISFYATPAMENSGGDGTSAEQIKNNFIDARTLVTLQSRTWPDARPGYNIKCSNGQHLPITYEEEPFYERWTHKALTAMHLTGDQGNTKSVFNCTTMVAAMKDGTMKSDSIAVIELLYGNDTAFGFPSSKNIFLLAGGIKVINGGLASDVFQLIGNQSITGMLDGHSGDVNMLSLSEYMIGQELIVHFVDQLLIINNHTNVTIQNIQQIKGRRLSQDTIVCACDTSLIDSMGGSEDDEDGDFIVIPSNNNCAYDLQITLEGLLTVENYAQQGNITYVANGPYDAWIINIDSSSIANNIIHLKYTIEELEIFSVNGTELKAVSETTESFLKVTDGLESTIFILKDKFQIRFDGERLTGINYINETSINLIEKYKPIAKKFSIIITIRSMLDNSSIQIGYGKDANDDKNHISHFENDPQITSHLVSGGSNGHFDINATCQLSNLSFTCNMADVYIHRSNDLGAHDIINLNNLYNLHIKYGQKLYIMTDAGEESKLVLHLCTKRDNVSNTCFGRIFVIGSFASSDLNLTVQLKVPEKVVWDNESLTLSLNPVPVIIDSRTTEVVLSSQDLTRRNSIIFQSYIFLENIQCYQYQNTLIITNICSFNEKLESFTLSLLLTDYFQSSENFNSATIQYRKYANSRIENGYKSVNSSMKWITEKKCADRRQILPWEYKMFVNQKIKECSKIRAIKI